MRSLRQQDMPPASSHRRHNRVPKAGHLGTTLLQQPAWLLSRRMRRPTTLHSAFDRLEQSHARPNHRQRRPHRRIYLSFRLWSVYLSPRSTRLSLTRLAAGQIRQSHKLVAKGSSTRAPFQARPQARFPYFRSRTCTHRGQCFYTFNSQQWLI
jgi:hypothetical protein